MEQLLESEPDDIRRRFVSAISRLSTKELEVLEKMAISLVEEIPAQNRKVESRTPSLDIDAEVAAYRAELEAQRNSQEEDSVESTASTGSSGSGKRLA